MVTSFCLLPFQTVPASNKDSDEGERKNSQMHDCIVGTTGSQSWDKIERGESCEDLILTYVNHISKDIKVVSHLHHVDNSEERSDKEKSVHAPFPALLSSTEHAISNTAAGLMLF